MAKKKPTVGQSLAEQFPELFDPLKNVVAAGKKATAPPKPSRATDASDRQPSKPPPARPGGLVPTSTGKLLYGPPAPLTPTGTRAPTVPSSEITGAVRTTKAAARGLRTADRTATQSINTYTAAAKAAAQAETVSQTERKRLEALRQKALADSRRFTEARDNYLWALDTLDRTGQRATEAGMASRTGGIYGAPPPPSKGQLQALLNGDTSSLTPAQRAYYNLDRESLLDKIGGPGNLAAEAGKAIGRTVGTPLAEVPGLGDVTRRIPGLQPYDWRGAIEGGAEGAAALTTAAAVPAAKTIFYSGQRAIAGLDPKGGAQRQMSPEAQAMGVDPTALGALGQAAGKVGVGGVAVSAGLLTNPLPTAKKVLSDVGDMARGITQLAGAGAMLFDPKTPLATKYDVAYNQIVLPTLQDYARRYGEDASLQDVWRDAQQHPGQYGLDAVALASGVSRFLTFFFALKSTSTIGEAIRAVSHPQAQRTLTLRGAPATTVKLPRPTVTVPRRVPLIGGQALPRTVRRPVVREPGGAPFRTPAGASKQVPITWARSPLLRAVLNRPYDVLSRVLEGTPARRVPIVKAFAESPRAGRALERNNARMRRRLPAEARGLLLSVQAFLKDNPEYEEALAVVLQKPEDFTPEEFVEAVVTNLKEMADTGEFTVEGKLTPATQRLLSEVRRYESRMEDARTKRRARASRRISSDQLNLAIDLGRLDAERRMLLDEKARLRVQLADGEISQEYFDQYTREYDFQLRTNDAAKRVKTEHLDDLSINLEEVSGPARDAYQAELEKVPYFAEDPQRVADAMTIVDIFARRYGQFHNVDPAEFYEHAAELRYAPGGEGIPEQAFAQRRPNIEGLDDDALNAAARAGYSRYARMAGAMPPGVKGWKAWANKGRELARLARMGAEHRDWYRESGLAIRERIGPDNWEDARKISAAIAYLSRTDTVMSNVGHALRAYTSWKETGDAGLAGRYPAAGQEKLNEIFKENKWGGYKTNSFFRNILEEYDPERFRKEFGDEEVDLDLGAEGEEVTVDRWIVRALGFTDDQVGQKGRYFAAREMIQHIADQFGWTPKQLQAAVWVAVKAESDAAEEVTKVAARNATNKAKHAEQVKKAKASGRKLPDPFKPKVPRTAEQLLQQAGVHVGTSLSRTTHQLRINAEAAPGSTYAGFPEYADFGDLAQEEFSREIAIGVHQYYRDLGIPFAPGDRGPGLYEPEGLPIETNPAFAVDVSIGSAMRQATAEKYGLPRMPDWQRREFDAIVAGQGRGTRQNAMPWLRPLVAENAADRSAYFVERDALTTDDMLALRAARGDDDWQIAISHGNGGVWLTLVKDSGLAQADFRTKVGTIVDEVFGRGTEAKYFAHEGGYVENDWTNGAADYERSIGNSRRSEEIRAASDALSDHYESARLRFTSHPDGPDGEALRLRDERERASTEQRVEGARGPPLAQTRRQDLYGATEWLETAPGKRIIYLTERADMSTLLHELVGHGAYEMKAYYPEEFVKVEQRMGKRLEDWTREDHEQFAQWSERYFASGDAPTPELVDVFDRLKTWMRSIYAALKLRFGPKMPTEVRVLFDTMLGAYDDENVFRVAVNMGREGWGREDLPIERWGSAMAVKKEELAALKRRQETRRARRSVEGMKVELADLYRQLEENRGIIEVEEGEKIPEWTPEQEAKLNDLTARILNAQSEIAIRTDAREVNLRKKIDSLEKALSRGFDNRRFQGALMAMQQLSEMREQILRDAFGDDFDAVFGKNFEDRRDLLADFLVARGLLRADFRRGTAYYFPHMTIDPTGLPPQIPAASLTSRVVGRSKTDLLNLYKRNQMILWQRGDWNADPAVLLEAVTRAQGFWLMSQIKKQLWDLGRKLTPEEAANLPDNVYLINLNGTPISRGVTGELGVRDQLGGGSATHDAQRVHDALLGTDNNKLEISLKNYWDNFALDSKALPGDFNPLQAGDEIRVVPRETVETLLRPLRGGRNAFGKTWDAGTTFARFALIYANAPAYMLSNASGNLGLLLLQQGPFQLARMMGRMSRLINDPMIIERIAGETGDLPAFAAISRGRSFDATSMARTAEARYLRTISIVDRYPRAIAWLYEANKLGYHSHDDLMRLLDGKTAKVARDRDTVSEFATKHMIDFNMLRPWEQQTLTRGLFIWPFVRGATAWPFWYTRNYPERAAILGSFGMTAERRRQEMFPYGVPRHYEGLFPISVNEANTRAQVIRGDPMSPTSTALGEIEGAVDLVRWSQGEDVGGVNQIAQMISPVAATMIELVTQRDDFGRPLAFSDILLDLADTFVPFERIAAQLGAFDILGGNRTPRAFLEDRGPGDRARRTLIRIAPQTVSIPWLAAQAQSHGDIPTDKKIEQETALDKQAYEKLGGKAGTYPGTFQRAVVLRVVYGDRIKEWEREKNKAPDFEPTKMKKAPGAEQKWDVRYHATPYEQGKVAYAVLQKYAPGLLKPGPNQVPSPDDYLRVTRTRPNSETGRRLMQVWKQSFFDPFASFRFTSTAEEIASLKGMDREVKALQRAGYLDEYQQPTAKPWKQPTEEVSVG